jgi:two-component system, OmpR family, response regulator
METKTVYKIGNYTFDYNSNLLNSPKERRKLTRKEADLLQLLADNPNSIIKRDFALKKIWGRNDYFMGRSMDVYISKLRKLLMEDPNVAIVNIHNTGFMLTVKE